LELVRTYLAENQAEICGREKGSLGNEFDGVDEVLLLGFKLGKAFGLGQLPIVTLAGVWRRLSLVKFQQRYQTRHGHFAYPL
jgi:hypothetical protein